MMSSIYSTNASRPYTVKPNSTDTKKGRIEGLSRYKALMCICINLCDKQSASSLNCKAKKKKRDLLSESFASFHHLSSIFCLHCYSEIISLFKCYSFDHWCAMAEFFPLVSLLLREQRGKNTTSALNFKLLLPALALLLTALYSNFVM